MSSRVYNVGSKGSKHTMPNRIVCFVCGSLGGEYQLRSRPCEGCAYFPFLEHHDPPKGSRIPGSDGSVDSCRVCYAFLTSQWETYERTNTPAIKRLYWLKRLDDGQFTGAEMKLQGEYMAQVMGLQYQPSCGDSCAPHSPDSRDGSGTGIETDIRAGRKSQLQDDSDHVLDLSVSFKTEPLAKASHKQHSSADLAQREVTMTRPCFEDFSFVCFTCGIENEGVAAKCISSVPHGTNEPFFPFLKKLTSPKGAVPLNGQGVCQVCDRCFSSLCHQWITYEHHGTPNSARIFKVNAQFFSTDSNLALGVVPDTLSASGEVCYLCSKSWSSSKICSLYTAPSGKGDQMYFPFIRELRRPPGARPLNPDGSVLVCVSCFSNLQDQWQCYEADKVPLLQRRYSLLPQSSASSITSLSLKPFTESDIKCDTGMLKMEGFAKSITQPLAVEISKSPTFAKNHTHSLPSGPPNQSSAAIGTLANTSLTTTQESSRHHSVDTKSHSSSAILSIPHPLQQAGERPKKVCFLCGEKCLLSKAQILYSYPVRHDAKNVGQSQTIPFFPFLATHSPALGSEPMTEEGTVISCSYCFYSLLNQWRDYEDSKGVTEKNRRLRKYTLNEFVCYVCGMMVPRKKMRTLEVHKFLFLREHKAPPNALVMWGGEGVGACGSCHYSLSHQFTEFERLGLPMELRKYNWTVQHHIEENGSDAHDSNHGVSSAIVNEDSNLSVTEAAEDSNHSSPQSTKPALSLISPASTFGKPMLKSALVLPQNRVSPNNGLTSSGSNTPLNTSRTASFAAALRNLAHHAKEPSDDVNDHSLTSPTSHNSHNSRSNTPKRAQANLVLTSHPATSFTSPPVITVAPTQSMMFQNMASFPMIRECQERSSTFDHWNKPVQDLPPLSTDDSGLGGKDLLLSRTPARVPAQRSVNSGGIPVSSQAMNPYARSFHAYRAEEEELIRHGLPLSYEMDPAAYAAAAYHPALLQQQAAFAQGSLRLSDSLLLDQYRMLQVPYLPFPTAGLISPHHLGIGMHTMLAAAAASQQYHPSLFPQHYPYLNLRQPMMDPQIVAQAAAMERNQLDAEKEQIKREREKSKTHEQSADRETSHRPVDSGEQDLVKREQSSGCESFGKMAFERRDIPTVPVCLSSHSPELLSRQYSESHNGHPPSRASSSMSTSSGHRPVSKISPGTNHPSAESSMDKSAHNLTLNTHHGFLRSQGTVSPPRSLTFKPYDKHHDSSHQQAVLDLHVHQGSTLPLLVRSSSSSSNSALEKRKGSSDFTPLFRPFDDNKQNVEQISTSGSGNNASLRHKQWQLDTSSSLSAFQKDPHTSSSASVLSNTDISPWTNPLPALSPSLVPKQHKLKEAANCLNERIEKFSFKSLACESTSSSSQNELGLVSSDVLAATEAKQFLSKHDREAARALERKNRGGDTDSDTEKDEDKRVRSRLTMVGRTTPIPLAASPPKIDMLEHLSLPTWRQKKDLGTVHSVAQLCEGDPAEKSAFVARLGLVPVSENQRAAFGSVCSELEKRRRYLTELSWARQSPLQSPKPQNNRAAKAHRGMKRKLSEAEDNLHSTQKSVQSGISELNVDYPHGYLGQFSNSSTPGSIQPTQHHDALDKTKAASNSEASAVHQSQQQDLPRLPGSKEQHSLSGAAHSLIQLEALKNSVSQTSKTASSLPPHVAYTWPGIEAVLESYQRHRDEQLAETQVLRERCRQLQTDHSSLEQAAHRVSRHMAYLIEENQRMLEERNGYQDAINHLKETFSSLK